MSLADLVPIAIACRIERAAMTSEELERARTMRWRSKNRKYLAAYKRAWRAKRKA